MLFLNPWLLAGLGAVAVPVVIHLVRRSAAKPLDWGAMRFLLDTVAQRRRRMEWEELLLMAARCLLLALAALAVARPFLPPDSPVPWALALPVALLGIAAVGASFVPSSVRWRWGTRLVGLGLLAAVAGLVILEKRLNLKRFDASGRRDVALVIDASSSMELARGGTRVFEQAIAAAKDFVNRAPRGTAFTVVLGGPAPELKTAAPLNHRADVIGVLDSLKPIGGVFRAHEALGVATLSLAEGTNPAKDIVVFTDSQRAGWRLDQPGAWDELAAAWKALPAKPKLLVRDFGAPAPFRNVALGGFRLSRAVVGTDREVAVRITVKNTGSEPLTPGPVVLEAGGRSVGEKPVGLLSAGQEVTVEFRHRFTAAGPQVIAARIAAQDDFPGDDKLERVIAVKPTLPVLLVDGNPTGSFFERAAGYAALALAPTAELIRGKSAGEANYLIDPRVVAANALREQDVNAAAVVVLADVPRLPSRLSAALADRVAAGAGLLVVAGPRVEPDFYNGWRGIGGPLAPIALAGEGADVQGLEAPLTTFNHEALAWIGKDSDFTGARFTRWRKTGAVAEGGTAGAALANGDVLLATRNYGNGRTMLVACALDARSGNLPARRSFVPFMHELVGWCAGGGIDLNVGSAWNPAVLLGSHSGGLSAVYASTEGEGAKPLLERVDPAIDFRWMHEKPDDRVPNDHFSIHWTGQLVAPVTGEYAFTAEVDDKLEVRIAGGSPWQAALGRKELGRVALEAGKPVAFEARYEEENGEAYVRLLWTPPGGAPQVVPVSAFLPGKAEKSGALEVLDPRGLPRKAVVKDSRRGRELSIEGPAVPGIYQVQASDSLKQLFPGMTGAQLPVAVVRDEAESVFEPWREDDRALVRQRIDLLLPGSTADLLGVMEGRGFGREIAKWLALAALAFLVLESVLARWVSRSRRIAEDVRVEFGTAGGIR